MNPSEEINFNLAQIFFDRCEKHGPKEALRFKRGGDWRSLSWEDWKGSVCDIAALLHDRGVKKESKVAILSENRPEWTYVDLATLALGGIVVPIYPTSAYEDVRHIIKNAEVEILFVSCPEHFERLKQLLEENLPLKEIITFDCSEAGESRGNGYTSYSSALAAVKNSGEEFIQSSLESVMPDDIATLIYTSGTTGPPKGVMLTHRNFVANYLSASEVIPVSAGDVSLSFLPLSHVFERLGGYYFMAFRGAVIAYAQSMQTVAEDIQVIKPTVAAAVPRFYEKIYAAILDKVETTSGLKKIIFHWASSVGSEVAPKRLKGERLSFFLKMKFFFASKLAFQKLKAKLGGRIRFFISGGAPLAKELAEFFYAADVLILEGYGLTETSCVVSVNSPECPRFGVVGRPLSVAEVKIAGDGEILTRGDCVMKGYYKDEKATREVIDPEGWFHTGDIGEIDAEGFLKITDRKKDIIVTSGGKNIAPQNIENHLLMDKVFSQVVLIGDKRNYLVALIVPSREAVLRFMQDKLPGEKRYEELLKTSEVDKLIRGRLNALMDDLPAYEQIKYFELLPKEFSIEAGELTPTLKVKRKKIIEKYSGVIESLYRRGEDYREQPSNA